MMKQGRKTWSGIVLVVALMVTLVLPAHAVTEPKITAASAVVMDYDTGEVIYAKDADTMRVPASMTKVMTAYIIFEELEAGNLTLDTKIPVKSRHATISRDSSYPTAVPLTAGSSISVDTLIKLIMIPSASASCIVVADYISGSEAAFVKRMNETAQRLGMTANYKNSHGAIPHTITARSQAILIRAFIQRFPQILEYTSLTSMQFNGRTYENTNKLLSKDYYYEGCDGFKTGTIAEAGYCLSATAQRNGRRLITVVMKSTSTKTRHTDSQALLNYGFAWLEANPPAPREEIPPVEEDIPIFGDIKSHWGRGAIETVESRKIPLHIVDGNYLPNQAITRGELTAMLLTALELGGCLEGRTPVELPELQDLAGTWGENEIRRAYSLGLVFGVGGSLFAPDEPITREQTMVILDNALHFPNDPAPVFSDGDQISPWAVEAVSRVTASGLFRGHGNGSLNPQGTLTRAEAAVVVCNLLAWVGR